MPETISYPELIWMLWASLGSLASAVAWGQSLVDVRILKSDPRRRMDRVLAMTASGNCWGHATSAAAQWLFLMAGGLAALTPPNPVAPTSPQLIVWAILGAEALLSLNAIRALVVRWRRDRAIDEALRQADA